MQPTRASRQENGTKPCPCGRGVIFTNPVDANKNYKVKIDGRELLRCVECALDEIYNHSKALAKERANKNG